ncbi:hypothetical protein VP01_1468g1 [Puccinia sorghi]|uniref:Uncharacterized protein n=1 Tax=Puccinia sorghi TaxID=27349 RepID=A0A0L6VJN8_9BASI|nr:hypothetical protein VP01_1468g1 [Puccinia sorghi]
MCCHLFLPSPCSPSDKFTRRNVRYKIKQEKEKEQIYIYIYIPLHTAPSKRKRQTDCPFHTTYHLVIITPSDVHSRPLSHILHVCLEPMFCPSSFYSCFSRTSARNPLLDALADMYRKIYLPVSSFEQVPDSFSKHEGRGKEQGHHPFQQEYISKNKPWQEGHHPTRLLPNRKYRMKQIKLLTCPVRLEHIPRHGYKFEIKALCHHCEGTFRSFRMERFLKCMILALSHLHFLTATGTQDVSKWLGGGPSQRAGLDGFQDLQKQLNPGAPLEPSLLPLFPTGPDLPPEMRESPQPTPMAPAVQTPILAVSYFSGNTATRPRSEIPEWPWNSPLPQFSPFIGASTANGKEGGSSMQAATACSLKKFWSPLSCPSTPSFFFPSFLSGAATTGGDAAQPTHIVPSGRDTREVEFQQPASKRHRLNLHSELPQFPASGQGITRLPGLVPPQFIRWYFTDGNNRPVSYQLEAASLAGHALPAPLPFYSYHANMPQLYPVGTVELPSLAHPPPPPFYSSGSERPSHFQLGTQALPGSAHPQESSVYSKHFQSPSFNPPQREKTLKAAAPQVGPPPPKYGSASGVGNANVIGAGSSSLSIDSTKENLRNSEKTRSTLLHDRNAVCDDEGSMAWESRNRVRLS